MENHYHDHEEPKPSNKWISTPILMAVLVIGCVVTFLSFASRTCDDKCCEKNKTEQHGTGHEDEHGTKHEDEHATTNVEVKDSTGVDSTSANHGDEHGNGHGDGHGH